MKILISQSRNNAALILEELMDFSTRAMGVGDALVGHRLEEVRIHEVTLQSQKDVLRFADWLQTCVATKFTNEKEKE